MKRIAILIGAMRSHCRNEIRMTGGAKVRVQHDHRMHDVPCLVPGERVRLRAA